MALAMAAVRLSVSASGVPSAPSTANRSMPFGAVGERREQLLGSVVIELLDIGNLSVAKLRELAPRHGRARQAIFFFIFELVHLSSRPPLEVMT